MAVSAESVKSFLESATLMSNVSEDKLSRYLSLYERATKTTTVLTGMPGGGGSDSGAVLATLADAEDDAKRWEVFVKERKKLVSKFINDADIDDYYKELLIRRYVIGVGWHFIFLMLRDTKEMSERKMYYDHNKALSACADWVNKTGKYKEVIDR